MKTTLLISSPSTHHDFDNKIVHRYGFLPWKNHSKNFPLVLHNITLSFHTFYLTCYFPSEDIHFKARICYKDGWFEDLKTYFDRSAVYFWAFWPICLATVRVFLHWLPILLTSSYFILTFQVLCCRKDSCWWFSWWVWLSTPFLDGLNISKSLYDLAACQLHRRIGPCYWIYYPYPSFPW